MLTKSIGTLDMESSVIINTDRRESCESEPYPVGVGDWGASGMGCERVDRWMRGSRAGRRLAGCRRPL